METDEMQISFEGIDLKTKINAYNQKQNEKIIKNLQTKKNRKECNAAFFGLTSVMASSVASPIITRFVKHKTKTKVHPLALNARIGFAILGAGILSGYVFNKIDEKKHTKFGDFIYKFFNDKNSLAQDNQKVDTNV